MANKKTQKPFQPFIFEDVDTKNSLLTLARESAAKQEVENILSSTMIFAAITEYLAQHLLENLRYFMYTSTYANFGAIIFLDQRNKEQKRGLGETIDALNEYEFPDKQNTVNLLKKFNKCRNHFFHKFMNLNNENVSDYSEDIRIIRETTEELIGKINVIYSGLGKILIPQPNVDTK